MKKVFFGMMTAVLLTAMISCDKNDGDPIDDAIKKSKQYFDGEVVKTEREKDDGEWVIKITMLNSKGAVVEFEFLEKNIELRDAQGEKGPFDYDVNFDSGLMNFQDAKSIADKEYGNDELQEWELDEKSDFNNKWVYEFDYQHGDMEIYIDAKTGDVLGND